MNKKILPLILLIGLLLVIPFAQAGLVDWFMELLDNEEGMTLVKLWSCEVGDEIGYASKFKYEIL